MHRLSFGLTALILAVVEYRKRGITPFAVITAFIGIGILISAFPRGQAESVELSETPDGRVTAPTDSRPIEPDEHGSVGRIILTIAAILFFVLQTHPLAEALTGLLPYRVVRTVPAPAAPMQPGDVVLVRQRVRPPEPGQVVWIGERPVGGLPELVTVEAIGPDSCECLIRPGGAVELESRSRDSIRNGRLAMMHVPTGAMRVAARSGPPGSDPDWVAIPTDWVRGEGVAVVFPPGRSLRSARRMQ